MHLVILWVFSNNYIIAIKMCCKIFWRPLKIIKRVNMKSLRNAINHTGNPFQISNQSFLNVKRKLWFFDVDSWSH